MTTSGVPVLTAGEAEKQKPNSAGVHAASLTAEGIADLRKRSLAYLALAADATRGPWTTQSGDYDGTNWLIGSFGCDYEGVMWHVTTYRVHASEAGGTGAEGDARFIAASHAAAQIIRELLDALPSGSTGTAASAPTTQVNLDAVASPVPAVREPFAYYYEDSFWYPAEIAKLGAIPAEAIPLYAPTASAPTGTTRAEGYAATGQVKDVASAGAGQPAAAEAARHARLLLDFMLHPPGDKPSSESFKSAFRDALVWLRTMAGEGLAPPPQREA